MVFTMDRPLYPLIFAAIILSLSICNAQNKSEPEKPKIVLDGFSENAINVTWAAGEFNQLNNKPVGEKFHIRYRMKGGKNWIVQHPIGDNFTIQLGSLYPGTTYEIQSVSETADGKQTPSDSLEIKTMGDAPNGASGNWLIGIIVAIIILFIILIIVCLVVRNRGAKYPVQEKEKLQGRQPSTADPKQFGEYAKAPNDDEKKSLGAGSIGASETDSMMEYAEGDALRFTEDGSFIGQYGAPTQRSARDSRLFTYA